MMPRKVASAKVRQRHAQEGRHQIDQPEREQRHQPQDQQIGERVRAEARLHPLQPGPGAVAQGRAQRRAGDQEQDHRAGRGADHRQQRRRARCRTGSRRPASGTARPAATGPWRRRRRRRRPAAPASGWAATKPCSASRWCCRPARLSCAMQPGRIDGERQPDQCRTSGSQRRQAGRRHPSSPSSRTSQRVRSLNSRGA